MYEQLVTPNLGISVVWENGKQLKSWLGYCLAVAETIYSSPRAGSTAWDAWINHTQHPHTDALPTGVYVPVYFSGYKGQGHVCIYKDGTCWSSPYTNKTELDILPFSEIEKIYGIKYVGWSEDMVGLKVIGDINMNPTPQNVQDYFTTYLGRTPNTQEIEFYTNRPWTNLASDVCDSQLKTITDLKAGQAGEFVEAKVYVKK